MFFLKITPSEFLKEMSMDTKQKLANTHEMHLPKIVELLDMGETSLQKVRISNKKNNAETITFFNSQINI